MTETTSSGTYEEKPKPNWFLWVAAAFFGIMILALWEMPNAGMKWAWMGIAILNLAANAVQINNTRITRYVLWKRGLSIYMGKSREALIRFDKAMMFRQFKGLRDAREDLTSFGVSGPVRSYPAFGGRRRWLVIYERDDGVAQALVFDPTPVLEGMFRDRLIEVDREQEEPPADDGQPAVEEDAWEEEETREEAQTSGAAVEEQAGDRRGEDLPPR